MVFEQYLLNKSFSPYLIQLISNYVRILEKIDHQNRFRYCLEEYNRKFKLQFVCWGKYDGDPSFSVNDDLINNYIARHGYKRAYFNIIIENDEIYEQCRECSEYYLTRTLNSLDDHQYIRNFVGKCNHILYPRFK